MKKIIKSSPRYQIIRELASGGMGSVAKAKLLGVEGFEKLVAIKTLLPRYACDEEFVKRFIFEAKLVANLVHQNIVQIYQLDRVDDEYFFVLEFVDGISLYDFVEFHKMIQRRLPAGGQARAEGPRPAGDLIPQYLVEGQVFRFMPAHLVL